MACHLQLRIQRPINRSLQTPQCTSRRAADAGGRFCTGIDGCHLRTAEADVGFRADIRSKPRDGDLLRRRVRGQLHLHSGRQHVTPHRQRRGAQLQADARIRADCRAALGLACGSRKGHLGIDLDRHGLGVLGCKCLQITQRLIGFGGPCVATGQRTQQGQGERGGHQQEGARIPRGTATAVAGGQFGGHDQSIELAVPYTPVDAIHEHFPRRRTTGMSVDLPFGR